MPLSTRRSFTRRTPRILFGKRQSKIRLIRIRAAIEAFKDIHGVRVPVASAFLTAMDPEQFTIIDRQAYKALGVKFRDGTSEYLEYLGKRLGFTLQESGQMQPAAEHGRR